MNDKQRRFDYDRGFAAGTAECETLRAQLTALHNEVGELRGQIAAIRHVFEDDTDVREYIDALGSPHDS